jgi:hypothetical protein
VLDVVLNHVGPETPVTREHPDWFHGRGAITDWNDPEQLFTRDVFGLPDLAQEKEEVYAWLLGSSRQWIDRVRPDGFRLDAARHVPPAFWARYTRDIAAHAGPQFTMYGEMYDGDAEGLSKTLAQSGFDAVFDFPLYFAMTDVFCKGRAPARLGSTLTLDRLYPDAAKSLVTFLDNHDLPRVASACGNDTASVVQAMTFLLTARGTPSFTYGTESGMEGAKEPENRGDMEMVPTTHPLSKTIRELLELRRNHPVFVNGASRPVLLTDELFAYARVSADGAALIAVNRGATEAAVAVPKDLAGTATDALTGDDLPAGPIRVPAKSVTVSLLHPNGGRKPALKKRMPTLPPVAFTIRGVHVAAGETIAIVGSSPELGSWNPAKGKALRPGKQQGTFVAEIPLGSGVYEWKLAVRGPDGAIRWEAGENRSLLLEGSAAVDVSWRSAPGN